MTDELHPDSLVLQALHAIRAEGQKTNQQLQQTNQQIQQTNQQIQQTNQQLQGLSQRLDDLRTFTVQGLTDLNHKVDQGFARVGVALDHHTEQLDRHTELLREHSATLREHSATLREQSDALRDLSSGQHLHTPLLKQQGDELHQLNARFDHLLTGEVSRRFKQLDELEAEVRRLAARVDH